MTRELDVRLRALPSVDDVLKANAAARAIDCFGRSAAVTAVRQTLDATRAALRAGKTPPSQPEAIADAAQRALTSPRGILAEPREPFGRDGDHTQFKGIFVRYLHELCQHTGNPAYRAFLLANADSVWDNARNPANQFGVRWAGPFDTADASRQASAAEALIAAAALTSA